ncbi:hypothetical protein [Streptomyces avermitilis]|uniref:hypothetical protein n=1 Tax=Streptomyces avermitilis TaxID=33903 RepID=UPI00381522FB
MTRRPLLLAADIATALAAGLDTVPQRAGAAEPRIGDIQGRTRISPPDGQQVSGVGDTTNSQSATKPPSNSP